MKSLKVRRSFSLSAVLILTGAGLLSACHPDNPPLSGLSKPAPPAAIEKMGPLSFEKSFGFFKTEARAEQQKHNENTITSFFQVKGSNNNAIENLKPEDLNVTENRTTVTPFKLELANRKDEQDVVEIALVVDITGTMKKLITLAKASLQDFVDSDEAKRLQIRICIATFGDRTVQRCLKFNNINPDQAGAAQRRDFSDELERLQACKGDGRDGNCADPGFPTFDENPMGALVDVANAPWTPNSRRFVILVTDWGFHYAPDNQGPPGTNAPTMKQVHKAIEESGMRVFAITRTQNDHTLSSKLEKNCTWISQADRLQRCVWDGYNTDFQGQKSIVEASGGKHFDFDAVLDKKIKFSSILNEIVRDVKVTYKLSYMVEKVQGLDPSLPIDRRDVQISLRDANRGTLSQQGKPTSSVPTGRPLYKKTFVLAEHAIRADKTFEATMKGQPINPNEYTVSGGEIRFKSEPPPGSEMKFSFFFENPDLNLKLEPISMRGNLNSSNTTVQLNGENARPGDVIFDNSAGSTSIGFNKSIMERNAPFKIHENQSLKVKIVSSAE